MTELEFRKSLPKDHVCFSCRKALSINKKAWLVMPFESSDFIAICALQCLCGCREVGCAGSTIAAHRAAQALRLQTLKDSGIPTN